MGKAVKEGVLIANGLSATGYEPSEGVYSVALNGGFLKHKVNAAFTIDCPGWLRTAWRDFEGDFGLDLLKAHYQTAHR